MTPFAPYVGGILGITAGACIAHGRVAGRMAVAAAALALLFALAPTWPSFALVAAVSSLALAIGGPRGARFVVGLVIGWLAIVVAMWCASRICYADRTASWPGALTSAVAAAAMGIVAVHAMLPRHISWIADPVKAAFRALPAGLDAEVQTLCTRSVAIWTAVRDRVGDRAGVALVRDGVLKTLEVAARSADVVVTGPTDAELAERMAELDRRIAAATDGEVTQQYRSARRALDDQARYRSRIQQGRERLVARMHNHVTALEKFELVAAGLEAARMASVGSSAVCQLEELSSDVAASGDALDEIQLSETPG